MPLSKTDPPHSPSHFHDQNYVVLPPYPPTPQNSRCRIITTLSLLLLLLLPTLLYIFWPSDPTIKIVRLRLNKLRIHTLPIINIDVSMHVTVKVRNVDVYSMEFRELDVAVDYRGKRLGHVRSGEGHVRALTSSYVDAEVEFSGVSVLSDVVFLIEDLKKGAVPFDTVTEVSGKFGLLFFGFPLKAKMSCGVLVNVSNQTIARQNCYPER